MDSACLALTRIAEAFARSPAHLKALCELGLIASIVQMVGVSESGGMTSQLQVSTFYGLQAILATMAAGSAVVAEALLQAGVSSALRNLLATSSLLSATAGSPGNVLRSNDQLGSLVALAAALLPPVPEGGEAVAAADGTAAGANGEACQRILFLQAHADLLQKFTADLLPLMITVRPAVFSGAVYASPCSLSYHSEHPLYLSSLCAAVTAAGV